MPFDPRKLTPAPWEPLPVEVEGERQLRYFANSFLGRFTTDDAAFIADARNAMHSLMTDGNLDIHGNTFSALIQSAIRDAVAAEREACAKIAENHKPRWANLSAGEDYIASDPMGNIAAAIRGQP